MRREGGAVPPDGGGFVNLARFEHAGIVLTWLCLVACEGQPTVVSATARDSGVAVQVEASTPVESPDAGVADVAVASDATPIQKPGNDAACEAALGWWAVNAAFDTS